MDDYLDVNSVADVSLVAAPDKYFNQRTVTSPFDRRLHFWLSSHEYEALFDELEQRKVKGDLIDLPMLQDIASQGGYGTQLIRPSSVDELAWECLQIAASSRSLETALHKIRSVCSSALNYHLGILIQGN